MKKFTFVEACLHICMLCTAVSGCVCVFHFTRERETRQMVPDALTSDVDGTGKWHVNDNDDDDNALSQCFGRSWKRERERVEMLCFPHSSPLFSLVTLRTMLAAVETSIFAFYGTESNDNGYVWERSSITYMWLYAFEVLHKLSFGIVVRSVVVSPLFSLYSCHLF